jgi:hypothetical protein
MAAAVSVSAKASGESHDIANARVDSPDAGRDAAAAAAARAAVRRRKLPSVCFCNSLNMYEGLSHGLRVAVQVRLQKT